MIRNFRTSETRQLLLAAAFSVIIILPIAFQGIPVSNDFPQHLRFAQTHHSSILAGDPLPSWDAEDNHGFGSPGIRIYPALSYYPMAFARILIGNWYDAVWIAFAFWMLVGALGIYYFARVWLSPKFATVAAIAYSLIPYHLSQIFYTSAYAEFAAAAILPFCFGALARIFEEKTWSSVVIYSFSVSFLILTHIPLTIIGIVSLGIFSLTYINQEGFFKSFFQAILGGLLAVCVTAGNWFTILAEMNWINHTDPRFSSSSYGYDQTFFPKVIYSDLPIFTALINDSHYAITLLSVLLAGILLYKKRTQINPALARILFLGTVTFLMATPASRFLWSSLSILQKLQFPWRWLVITSIFGALSVAFFAKFLVKERSFSNRGNAYLGTILALIFAIYICFSFFLPSSFDPTPRQQFEAEAIKFREDLSFDCWWAKWSNEAAIGNSERAFAGKRETDVKQWEPSLRKIEVAPGNEKFMRVATYYYPHWKADVNGSPAIIKPDEHGAILISLPKESSNVKLEFVEPIEFQIAHWVSIFSTLLLLFLFIACIVMASKPNRIDV